MNRIPSEHHKKCLDKYLTLLIEPLKQVARDNGYCLLVHGSLNYDIDLVAVPWTSSAIEPVLLAEKIRQKAEADIGYATNRDKYHADNPEYFDNGCPGAKPHGRLVWSFHLGGGPYIDLSVFPIMKEIDVDS